MILKTDSLYPWSLGLLIDPYEVGGRANGVGGKTMADLSALDVRQLLAFDAVVTAGTFSRAAERLGYTQGAISQQIAALERMVGAPLFDRPGGPRPATLTPLGLVFAERGRDLLNRVEALQEELDRARDGRAGVLGIASFQSVTAEVLPPVLAQMRRRFPALQYRIIPGESDDELLDAVESRQADVAFVGQPAPRLRTEAVLADPWVVLAEPGTFPPGDIAPHALHQRPVIGQDADTWQRQCEIELSSLGVTPNFTFRTSDNATAAAMVRAGIGPALLPLLAAVDHAKGLVIHSLVPPLQNRQILLGRALDRTVPPSVEAFAEITKHVCAELSQTVLSRN